MKEIVLGKLDFNEACRYLGYGNNKPDEKIISIMNVCEEDILNIAKPKYVFKEFDIEVHDDAVAVVNSKLVFTGKSIVKHLADCNKVILLCATISNEIDKYIRLCEIQDMTKAYIADALSSVAIEQVCDKFEENLKLLYSDKYFTYRFGLGYGDLPLDTEPIFLNVLNAPKLIGVCSSESYTLMPRKSVVCIIGMSQRELKIGVRGCTTCNMKERCSYRTKGGHCGY